MEPDLGERPPADRVLPFALRVWTYKMGERVSLLIHLGDRLGLYRAMAGARPLTASEVAGRTGLNERVVREWLLGNAAADLLVSADGERFELDPAAAEVLAAEESSEWFAAGAFGPPLDPAVVDGIAESFRTGVGVPYDAHGPAGAHVTARGLGPWVRTALVPRLLPLLDGVEERLRAGARVVDVGCGAAVALTALAREFPASTFVGYDPSAHAVAQGRERVAEAGLGNVELVEAAAADLPPTADTDLVLTFDCLHDMPRPDEAARAIRAAIAPGGTWLVKEIRSSGSFAADRRNPVLALLYGMSVSVCLQSSLSEPGGPGYGTLGLPPADMEALARAAGFGRFATHDIGEPPNLYYEIRP